MRGSECGCSAETARASASPPPAARTPSHPRGDGRRAGERQPGTRPGGMCANRGAHRGSRRVAREATRHARGRSARHPARSVGAPAAEHAAALWQLCCRIGTTTTIACPVVDSRARCHRVQMATMAERGANAGTARRARDGRRAYPANRHRVCIRTRSGVRRLTILVPIGATFGHGTRTRTLSRTLAGREASKCAVRRQIGRQSQT